MRRTVVALAASCLAATAGAQETFSAGTVWADANADGARQEGERGLRGVAVSNGDEVAVTDAEGRFRLAGAGTGVVFVSVPDGYRAVGPFWRKRAPSLAFGLAPAPAPGDFTFVHASDTHVAPDNVGRTRRLGRLVDSIAPAFLLITGDLVRDALRVPESTATGYYELFQRETGRFRTPVFTVPGNHEVFGVERERSGVSPSHPLFNREMYRHYRGPDYYSFTRGGVHFVGLNTVDVDGQWYHGHVDSVQLAWLARDLALVPESTPVVTFDHIPFVTTMEGLAGYRDDPPAPTLITVRGRTVFRHTVSNAGDVLAVLRRRRHVLALGGHVHAAERIAYEVDGLRTRFHQSAAVVAPSSVAGLRFTSGVTVYRVRDGVIDDGRFVPLGVP